MRVGTPVYVSFEGKLFCTVAGHVRAARSRVFFRVRGVLELTSIKSVNKRAAMGTATWLFFQKDFRIDRASKFGT